MWDSFEARGGIMCKACERRGRACTPTDLITARGLLRISRLFWQLEINRAVNEHPQRGGHVSPGLARSGLARTGPARSHAVLGEAALMVLADTSAWGRFFGAPQNREGKLLSRFLFPGARGWHDWYQSTSGTTGHGRSAAEVCVCVRTADLTAERRDWQDNWEI